MLQIMHLVILVYFFLLLLATGKHCLAVFFHVIMFLFAIKRAPSISSLVAICAESVLSSFSHVVHLRVRPVYHVLFSCPPQRRVTKVWKVILACLFTVIEMHHTVLLEVRPILRMAGPSADFFFCD